MDSNNWRQPSQTEQPPMDGAGGDWRAQLQADSRQRIVNEIMDTLKRHLPSSGHEGVQELEKIAMRFEEKIYHAANSQSDYLRTISLKMLTMESKSNAPGPILNAIPSNSPSMSRNSQDPGSLDSTAQTGSFDTQEEVYQKIKVMKDLYFADVHDLYQKISLKVQQHDSVPQQPKSEGVDKIKFFKQILERILSFLQVPKSSLQHYHKEKLVGLEKQILSILSTHKPRKPGPPLQQGQILGMSPLAPSPMPGDTEKPNSGISATSNAANIVQQQTSIVPASASSLAIGTPGISASPLLAESSPPDGHGANLSTLPGKSGATEQPLERLLKVVKSMSPKAVNAAVGDIVSVVSMIDRIAGSAPGNGSRAAVGEDLVAMTKCRLQARNFITQDGSSGMKRMRRYTSAIPLNVASCVGSPNNSFKQFTGSDTSELESSATSTVKRPRLEVNAAIMEEIKEINEHLIDTVVDLCDEDADPTLSAVAAEGGEGTIVKCTFSAVSLSSNLKSQYCSAQMSPIQPLRLLVPANYPNCSPILLDKFPVEVSKEFDDLSVKVKSRFSISLRALSQPMSLRDIARTWDDCARSVITGYAQMSGGGTFSSKYGSWENCLTAA